jgi:hypothetical protein
MSKFGCEFIAFQSGRHIHLPRLFICPGEAQTSKAVSFGCRTC